MISRISKQAFARRRRTLMDAIGRESVAILFSAPMQIRSRDVDYKYRQDSDFYYLTGFKEPEAIMVLSPGREEGEFVLFCRERDRSKEIWDGIRAGTEGAVATYNADEALPIASADQQLPSLLKGKRRVYYAIGRDAACDQRVIGWGNAVKVEMRNGINPPAEWVAIDTLLHDQRLRKCDEEQAVMREVAEISAQAHVRAMEFCRPGLHEYQLEAEYLHEFYRYGCQYSAYPSIVGGGKNGCILHYIENSDELKAGDLVLVDAGGELDGYAADITRTFPVSGRFSEEQKLLYELVLAAQLAAMKQVKPGNHWNQPHEAAVKEITEGLVVLGLLEGEPKDLIDEGAYRAFYMHKTGHWLGLDVHDVGRYKIGDRWQTFELGMVLTVEPGIYVSHDCDSVDEKWRGIGIRIEDNLLVTADGHEVLTAKVPKSIEDIEALMGASSTL